MIIEILDINQDNEILALDNINMKFIDNKNINYFFVYLYSIMKLYLYLDAVQTTIIAN